MKAIFLPLMYGLTGACVWAAVHHALIGLRRPLERTHLLFASMAFLLVAYIVVKAGAYRAGTAEELVFLRRWEYSFSSAVFVLFPWFVASYAGIRSGWLTVALSAFMALLAGVGWLLPYGLVYVELPQLHFFTLPWGETVINLREDHANPWFRAGWIDVYLIMAYSVWGCVRQYRRGAHRAAVTFAVALGLFFSTVLFNQAVNYGLVRFVHLGEFGFVGLLLVMSLGATRELRESERRMRAVLAHVPAVVYLKDVEGRYLFINRRYEELFQVGNDAMAGKTDLDLFPKPVADSFRTNDRRVLDARRPMEFEEVVNRNGAPRVYESLKFPLLDADGLPYALCGISSDVTAQRRTSEEMRLLRQSIWHADRVERTGAITSSLAHELNQPLMAILSNAQAGLRFLDREPPEVNEMRAILEDIVRDDKRASAVITGLRAMLKRQETHREHIDLGRAVEEVLDLMHSEFLTRGVEIHCEAAAGCLVLADKAQIQQVLLNLTMNAIEAMAAQPAGSRHLWLSVAVAGGKIRVVVRDSGMGIPREALEKIFDGFFTTKSQGLGIGLAVCRSILESHGGRIWAENNADRGATFCFTLPPAREAGVTGAG
jgi:PAS domain S-box-containing protein